MTADAKSDAGPLMAGDGSGSGGSKEGNDLERLREWWDGAHRAHSHCSARNLLNAFLVLVGAAPTIGIAAWVYSQGVSPSSGSFDDVGTMKTAYKDDGFLSVLYWSPLLMINFLFFVNVDCLFYIIGLLQRSFWLIDPYWTLFPPLFGLIWLLHPRAYVGPRVLVANCLVWVWSARLTHSYMRREGWKFGVREDWRYTKMAMDMGRPVWYFVSFFAVGVAQHPMLVGISLPLYSVAFASGAESPFGWLDYVATILCATGILVACVADNQLRNFMLENQARVARGQPKQQLLETGLWRYSRHPNYFGEQLWWWSLALFAVRVGQAWAIAGTALNSVVLATVTVMTESKMLREWPEARAKMYRQYQKRTSACIPWFRCDSGGSTSCD